MKGELQSRWKRWHAIRRQHPVSRSCGRSVAAPHVSWLAASNSSRNTQELFRDGTCRRSCSLPAALLPPFPAPLRQRLPADGFGAGRPLQVATGCNAFTTGRGRPLHPFGTATHYVEDQEARALLSSGDTCEGVRR